MSTDWKKQTMKRIKHPWQKVACAALLVALTPWSLWAGGTDGPADEDYLTSGDSVGTLPIVMGGNEGFFVLPDWNTNSVRDRAAATLVLPISGIRQVVEESNGTGWLEWTALENGRAQLRLFGQGELVLDEAAVESGEIQIALRADTPDTWFYAAQVDGWTSAAAAADAGEGVQIDLTRALPGTWGVAPLTLHSMVQPGKRSQLHFVRSNGVITMSQVIR